jgi:predicted alpha-1,2-mannosidase
VLTTRGTNSSGSFSRGNNIPATAVPHGFNFWTPMTNAGSTSWLYEYQRANNADNLPTIQAFAASHEPSPWMGDRQTFQVMPSTASTPDADRRTRALAFRHANEVARPHYYRVTFENGLRTEIAPTDHAALLRFTFPGATSSLIFDNVNEDGGLTIDPKGVVTGYSDVRSGLSNGATRLFVYATFDRPIKASGMLDADGRPAGYARFDASSVNMRIATSLISVQQAKRNLALELDPADTLERVRARAQRKWDDKLDVIDVDGATDDQRTTLYSNLYRLSLYPNSAFENTGSATRPRYRHAVQSATDTPPSTPTETGAPVVDGKVYVNNGFWDTYRTTWAAYSLLDSRTAGELVDGFVQQYRDGGWIARWSSPGYANLMTGTSSDVSFADAYVKGVQGFDGRDAYDAALKNATVEPDGDDPWDSNVGRKGLFKSLFLGYTPSRVSEGVSWALEGDINDYGIGNMAAALARNTRDRGERRRLEEESEYFLSRAQNYVNMFDPAIGFFQGRAADGTWKSKPPEYDPREWGHEHDYTETNGWGFAFHAPQDGQGLANLYGGRDGLAAKLDEFFATPETAKFVGSYGGTIHEMIEARDVRMGQWGFSNQVSHHIPYMYDYAGQPSKTQAKVREALRRLYLGSDIGQGYAGDEDNGETSAWYLFSALGFYPLQMGSPYYAIGSPLFRKATVHLGHGRDLVVRARNNSARNVYVQGLRLNGRAYDRSYLRHEDIARGATLEFVMGPRPSRWGAQNPPPSLTRGDEAPRPLRDVTGSGSTEVPSLFDDDSSTSSAVSEPVGVRFGAPQAVSFYTLTSVAPADAPRDWALEGSDDGTHWRVLDERRGEAFRWRAQTRPFKVARPGAYTQYRLRAAGTLAEVELLNREAVDLSPLVTEVAGVVAGPGETVDVPVTVSNYGAEPASGDAALSAPSGWTVDPASAPFGPLARGESATATFGVTLPDDVAPGTYPLTATAGGARATGTVTVVGDAIEFSPETDAEAPWLFERDGSQFDGTGRYADGGNHYTYRFQLPADVTGGTFTLHMHAEFLVRASTDNEHWTTVLRQEPPLRDGSNDADYTLDLDALRGDSRTLYLRFEDSKPDDGWGAWLSHLRLELERG